MKSPLMKISGCVVLLLVIIITVFMYNGCAKNRVQKRELVTMHNDSAMFKEFTKSLSEFISKNKHDRYLQTLNYDSLEGTRIKKRDDLWFIGQWAMQKFDSYNVILGRSGKKVFERFDSCFMATWMVGSVDRAGFEVEVYFGKKNEDERLIFVDYRIRKFGI